MSIESAIEKLADAINRLVDAEDGNAAQAQPEAAADTDSPRRRGRPAKTDTPAADADAPSSADDTTSPSPSSTDTPRTVVDAGTGQAVELPAAVADRAAAKTLGVQVATTTGGADKLEALLRKHSGIADGKPGFSKVPDEAIPAFIADCRAELAMAD